MIPPGWTPKQVRERLDAATPGPWEVRVWGTEDDEWPDSRVSVGRATQFGEAVFLNPRYGEREQDLANAAFIAHAPEDMRNLLALLGEAREALWALNDWLAETGHWERMPDPLLRMCGALLARLPAPEDAA